MSEKEDFTDKLSPGACFLICAMGPFVLVFLLAIVYSVFDAVA